MGSAHNALVRASKRLRQSPLLERKLSSVPEGEGEAMATEHVAPAEVLTDEAVVAIGVTRGAALQLAL